MKKFTSAIIAAGGSSSRMGFDKLFHKLLDKPVIIHSITAFDNCNAIDEIIVTIKEEKIEQLKKLVLEYKFTTPIKIVKGGESRQQSVFLGALATNENSELLCVHDGARPLITQEVVLAAINNAIEHGVATAAVKAKDTIKQMENSYVVKTLNRDELALIQTPQVFYKKRYFTAYKSANIEYTDDCAIFEEQGVKVFLSQGDYNNIKLTTKEDFTVAETILLQQKQQRNYTMRIGHGYDVHKFVKNRPLILGGVNLPFEMGLLGHSDADVLVHSIMDSLLGAAALGDIGKHFPDNDDAYKGADSIKLLGKVAELLEQKGYAIVNIDATVVAQKPKLAEYIDSMRENIAIACKTNKDCVSVKATTEEGLGFTGEMVGIKSYAVCLLKEI